MDHNQLLKITIETRSATYSQAYQPGQLARDGARDRVLEEVRKMMDLILPKETKLDPDGVRYAVVLE